MYCKEEALMSETIEKTFTVSSPARLELSNIRGSVEILPGEDGVIQVTATKQTSRGDAKQTEVEMTQAADGTVKVVTHFPDSGWSWLVGSFPCPVEYVVHAPRQCSLKVNGVSNEAYAQGFEGEFAFKTVSGEMTLHNLTGKLRINTVSGKVLGKHLNGALRLDTVSGKVTLDESDLPSVEATTVSGEMTFQTPLGAGPYRMNSVSGGVRLVIPTDAKCSAELHAVSGKLFTKLPTTSISNHNGSQLAEVQGGGVKVYLHSVSGSLFLAS